MDRGWRHALVLSNQIVMLAMRQQDSDCLII